MTEMIPLLSWIDSHSWVLRPLLEGWSREVPMVLLRILCQLLILLNYWSPNYKLCLVLLHLWHQVFHDLPEFLASLLLLQPHIWHLALLHKMSLHQNLCLHHHHWRSNITITILHYCLLIVIHTDIFQAFSLRFESKVSTRNVVRRCYFVWGFQSLFITVYRYLQGVPKKMGLLSSFEFLGLGGVFLGVKNNSKNFGNKEIYGCL